MGKLLANWVEEARAFPVAFAQVREDALLDRELAQAAGSRVRALLVASGGCTAAALAALPNVSHMTVVDPNPAQLALTRLKIFLLRSAAIQERMALLGHLPLRHERRRALLEKSCRLASVSLDSLGPRDRLARCGPDLCGRYESVFAALRALLCSCAGELESLLGLSDCVAQARRVAPGTRLGSALERAFRAVMSRPNLRALFGKAATGNILMPFSRHFLERTRQVLGSLPAAGNPYLAQVLLGKFHNGAVSPWLSLPRHKRLPPISWKACGMTEALRGASARYHFIHLSNILDWLDAASARRLLALASAALQPGGSLIVRQLNSRLDIRALGGAIFWDEPLSRWLGARDRSYFYRELLVGRGP